MSKTNKNTRTLRKYIWRIWQATSKNHKKKKNKNKKKKLKTKKKEEILMRYTNLQLEFIEPLTLFLSLCPPCPAHCISISFSRSQTKNCSDKTDVQRGVRASAGKMEGNFKLSATFKTSFRRVHKSLYCSLRIALLSSPTPAHRHCSVLHCL